MQAAQIVAPRRIEWIDVPVPEPEAGQIVVRLETAALCGSDLPFFLVDRDDPVIGDVSLPLAPWLSLHEIIGRVTRSRSERFPEGSRVLALPYVHQGLGEQYLSEEAFAIPIPEGPGDRLVLAQPLGTVVHACLKLPNVLGQTAVVVGQGPIGQLFTALLRRMGVLRVIAVDLLPERLEVARKMGATHAVCGTTEEVAAAVQDLTGGQGADLAVEAVGYPGTLDMACRVVRRAGVVLGFGVPHRNEGCGVPVRDFFFREGRLINSVGPDVQREFPIALDLIAGGTIDVSPLVTHHFPLHRAGEAFTLFADRADGALKVILQAD